MKTCGRCRISKTEDSFHKSRGERDGLYGICKECRKPDSKAYREKNGAVLSAKWRESYKADPTKHRQNVLRYQRENWEYRKSYCREWLKKNPGYANKYTAARYAALKQSTPPWLSKEQKAAIKWWYDTARDLQWLSEEPLCVDHIEPIRGEISSGLHVPWNLQILSLSQNSRKGNKLGPS